MNEFKVGEYVIPNALNKVEKPYSITNVNMKLGKVDLVYSNGDIRVQIAKHADPSEIGRHHGVQSKYFDPLTYETLFDMMVQGNISESDYETNIKLINT